MTESRGRPINVSLRVIADLSQGLYRSPADALKELVSNSYDADSPDVRIEFSSDMDSLTIRDTGKGMTLDEFVETMETIGGTAKRSAGAPETTPSGRKIIGRIGIGLLSVSQIATALEVESTVEGSTSGFKARIEFDQFASEEARKIKVTDLWEGKKQIKIGTYSITVTHGVGKQLHFTVLKLSDLKRTIAEKLLASEEKDGQPRLLGYKIKTADELVKWMYRHQITKTGLHEYDRIFWELCTLCPVRYMDRPLRIYHSIGDSSQSEDFQNFVEQINKETHFKVRYDGVECLKPILMPLPQEKTYSIFFNLLFMKGLNGGVVTYRDYDQDENLVERELHVRGYIYFQRPKIWPPELRGMILRVRNVGVGQYDSTFMTYRKHEGFKFSQITGEILVDDLDAALNIDRSSFRETESAYGALRDAIHEYLSRTVFPGIKGYSTDERTIRRESESKKVKETLQRRFTQLDSRARKLRFAEEQDSLVHRSGDQLTLALSLTGQPGRVSPRFHKIVAFLEAYLSRKLTVQERDELYNELHDWLSEFE